MLNQMVWSLRYSLEGALKRVLFVCGQPQSEADLEREILQHHSFFEHRSREPLRTRIQKALTATHGCFVQNESGWTLRELEEDPLHEEIYRLFQEQNPLRQGEILRLLQQRTHRSKGELMSRIDLERDWRFARLEDGDWVLTEWELNTLTESTKSIKEEPAMNQQTDIVSAIIIELDEYFAKLQARDQEIPQDVIRKFESEDLAAIQALMEERKRVTGLLEDLKTLTDKWNGQKTVISNS